MGLCGRISAMFLAVSVVVALAMMELVDSDTRVKRQSFRFPPQGEPGVDFPTYNEVPSGLSFSCVSQPPGYYADPETQCQVWHWCDLNGRRYSFLCPNQTMFNQAYRVCDWWYNVDCAGSTGLYNINDDLYKDTQGNTL